MIIFLRLRKSPQTPKKKSVKETPKYLKASIGIVYFYAMCEYHTLLGASFGQYR